MFISNDIKYIGVNDKDIDLFEGQYKVPNGISYNSYAIIDEKIAIMDTVDARFTHAWLDNIQNTLGSRKPDYLIIQHMEPDHSANIHNFVKAYPEATIVSSAKAFAMMKGFFGTDFTDNRIVVGEGDTLNLGKHTLTFVTAPMVHWPEVIVTYDSADKVLFSADGFGKFGALDTDEPWADESRRYFIGIVGKYGAQVQALLKRRLPSIFRPSARSTVPFSARISVITSISTTPGQAMSPRRKVSLSLTHQFTETRKKRLCSLRIS